MRLLGDDEVQDSHNLKPGCRRLEDKNSEHGLKVACLESPVRQLLVVIVSATS